MAFDFLNQTTYSKPLQMQEELISQLMNGQQQQQQGYDFSDLEEMSDDADLIEIMAQEEQEEQQEEQDDRFAYETEEENDLSTSTDQLIANMLLDERESDGMGSVGTFHSGAAAPQPDIRRRDRTPRIWFPQEGEPGTQQYGGYAKKPKYQTGGVAPYHTSDPNDPRFQRYNDSLSLHNAFKGDIGKLKTMGQKQWWDYVGQRMNSPSVKRAEKAFDRLGQPKPISTYGNPAGDYAQEYAAPKQPIVLRESPLYPTKVADVSSRSGYDKKMRAYEDSLYNWNMIKDNADKITPEGVVEMSNQKFDSLPMRKLNYDFQPSGYRSTSKGRIVPLYERPTQGGDNINVQPSGRFLDPSQKPTKYSITYRDESSPSKQNSTYFNSKKEWQDFINSGVYNPISTSQTEDSATAAGYVNRQYGGMLYANDEYSQTTGLNDPSYNNALLNLRGVNTIRGLDNYQPVAVTDGRKYKILKGPKDTAKFSGPVYEQRLNS
jgi:hypothetical protein